MAYMIPETPREFHPLSKEDVIFSALEKLGEEYNVYHSVSVAKVEDDVHELRQTDFIVFNPEKGVICIEAKAGDIAYKQGRWVYLQSSGNDIPLTHDGPFNQVSTYTQFLIRKMKNICPDAVANCRFIYAVWFPSMTNLECSSISFPMECEKELVLTADDLADPTAKIESIFKLNPFKTSIVTNKQKCGDVAKALAPEFVISLGRFKQNAVYNRFVRLLDQQYAVLEYLREQTSAVICGSAGTGKTMVAVERARRCALNGDRVLFLSFTSFLCDHLEKEFSYNGVDYMTFSKLAKSKCGGFDISNSNMYYKQTTEFIKNNGLGYKHIIIDEGQDICLSDELIELAQNLKVSVEKQKGSFYIFFDKKQAVLQNYKRPNNKGILPEIISDADCKITLYRNCRNTKKIAVSSLSVFSENGKGAEPEMMQPVIDGDDVNMYYVNNQDDQLSVIDMVLAELRGMNYEDSEIVILTVAQNESSSCLASHYVNNDGKNYYNNSWFTTAKKYKGLEAAAIIMIDVTKNTFLSNQEEASKFYVASSRARTELRVISTISQNDCGEILQELFKTGAGMNPFNKLANRLGMVNKMSPG